MEQEKQLEWFPGHMMKATRAIVSKLPIIDVVIEILDARAPLATSNFMLEEIVKNKVRIVVLNKTDRANPIITKKWITWFQAQDIIVIETSAIKQKIKPILINLIEKVLAEKIARQKARGIKQSQFKVLVLGVPNVGKSTFINNLLQRKVTKAADTPGVTKGQQWVKLNQSIDLLDSPGILVPKISKEEYKFILALIKALPTKHLFLEVIANYALRYLLEHYCDQLSQHFQIKFTSHQIDDLSLQHYFQLIAEKYHFKINNEEWNINRAMNLLIHDLQTGKIGLVSFETPN